ncbi:iporin isoform X1 [Gadus morhua]|uniref:Iporin n=1 Tax=Gadus morhua TaxID=8049 RepID=A0A8C5FGN2_GADMO|nr:iporin-like isoform X1 [Gadus morhua]
MDRSPKLSGETLIVHHIPLVHCQVSGSRQAGSGGSLKRSNPFSSSENLGLSRTTSLPETDILQKDGLLYGSLVHTSSGGRAREARDERRGDSSTNSQDHLVIAHTLPRAKTCNRNPLRHNPFLLNTDHCEEDEEEDEDGDNLYGYLEDSSFHLHGRASSTLEEEVLPFRLHDLDLGSEPFALRGALGKKWGSIGEESQESLRGMASELSNHLDDLRLLGLAGQRRHGSSGSNMSMDCVEQDWAEEDEDDEDQHMGCGRSSKTVSSCNSHDYQEHFLHSFPEPFSEGGQQGYGSDSSCNSSDGVLVNFSAIYNKMSKPTNLNYSRDPSLSPGSQRNPTVGAFYLDLHTSPNEPLPSHQQNAFLGQPAVQEPHPSTSSTRSSSTQEGHDLDANCNSYHPLHSGSSGDFTSCLQSQARLVVATQNYYKLVTCDLSSQSSPSPVGSSATSCSEEPSKGSPTPNHPREYYLFRPGEDTTTASLGPNENEEKNEDDPTRPPEDRVAAAIQGQLYVNSVNGNASCAGGPRPRSRSYDRNLGQVPPARLGSLERMLSCPVRLSDKAAQLLSPPPRVTSFAEIARSKRRSGGGASSPTLKEGEALFSGCPFTSLDAFPPPEPHAQGGNPGPSPLAGCCSMGSLEPCLLSGMEAHAQGSLCISKDGSMEMVRYSKDQRPTSLPIQPFSFQHPLGARPPQPKPQRPLLAGMGSGVGASGAQTRGPAGTLGGEGSENSTENVLGDQGSRQGPAGGPPPGSIRPSPLGSYSPVRHQGVVSSGTCSTCTPSPQSACSRSCLLSPGLGPLHSLPSDPFRQAPPPDLLGQNAESIPPTLSPVQGHCYHGAAPSMPRDVLGSLVGMDSSRPPDGTKSSGCRPYNAHHLSPQALKWREYRRRNPLGVERSPDSASGGKAPRRFRRNVFDFPSAPSDHASSSHAPRHHGGHSYSELLLDYFSLTEKPPEEFCLSPEPPSSKPSVDLPHKKGLVKAVNTAVDLIVAHFGTSRDPDVKAKLGNSWVSPNVGHLILKYLCPALREVLQDGLKAHLLDLIVGQRRCQPWSLVEASTQLGPSTRLLYALFSKVSQFSELTSHHMRLNAFIFGLLNLRSLEFWFNHVYTHEDIVAAHYDQRGFLPLSQGPCRALFEELLLLLQPLSLLPFDLDVLFESHLLQKDQEHLLRKLQLCSVDQSTRSTFQLMRGWGAAVTQSLKEGGEAKKERAGLRREGTGPRMEGTGGSRDGGNNFVPSTAIVSRKTTVEGNLLSTRVIADLWPERGISGQRMKGVGEESHAEDGQRKRVKERDRDLDRQAGWWYQLMQSSQVYIDPSAEGSKFIKSEKRRRSSERRQPPPSREGVVEGAESKQEAEEHVGRRSLKAPIAEARSRTSWMGSPPESVLSQEKETAGPEAAGPGVEAPGAEAQATAVPAESPLWGRLFGSTLGSPSRKEGAQQRARKSRPPSGWLGLDRSVLDLMTQTLGSGTGKKESPILPSQSKALNPTSTSSQPSPCEVRALCHHIASEPGHLSFHKGDRLKVLNKASADWLLCSLGESQGLVPIVYITLEHKEDRL